MFVSSPLCCPSRSSIFTCKYVHNHHAINNSVSGGCSSHSWQTEQETNTFPVYLQKHGYKTFFAGKYLNQYGFPKTGGPEHVPPGWDWWNGLVGNSRYYGYSESVNGTKVKHGNDYHTDYYTDVIHRRGVEFLSQQNSDNGPFFMMLSTPACHAPFTPAPQYSGNFSNRSAPRDPIYNTRGKNKHWLVRNALYPMPNDTVVRVDEEFRNRWRTLLSVDDMVEDIITLLKNKNLYHQTYLIFSSDNGYHLGQFSMPEDKRQLYEFDIRVPLMISGPGIKPGQTRDDMVMNIDIGQTILDLAGAGTMSQADGITLVPLFPTDHKHLNRTEILIEHSGESQENIKGCPQLAGQRMANCDNHCVCEDSWNNTFNCLRLMTTSKNYKYCQIYETKTFIEVYELNSDIWEENNIKDDIEPSLLKYFNTRLQKLIKCLGNTCY
ncbi:hypothetical protein LOTGIDRAFT_208806 [Lottia gigantea]|uniref:Sulfatase N-terminal domain-containing protein n=1 Tax=Lottia gigantea TaxID=225164 RepID=V4C7K4_LOTGI|nr:hypothetical protein LOTGIDRAFT_208806 [Lottia gigantea]ESO97679.1 hypothetical protein LOTGIDRAFT_208806 [Lottia gigantea]